MITANDIAFESVLRHAFHIQQRNRLLRGAAFGLVFSLAIMAATAGLIEMYFRVAR